MTKAETIPYAVSNHSEMGFLVIPLCELSNTALSLQYKHIDDLAACQNAFVHRRSLLFFGMVLKTNVILSGAVFERLLSFKGLAVLCVDLYTGSLLARALVCLCLDL
jgi:hypothetical protein